MATTDTTRIIIDLESRLRNLERTLRGLDAIKKRLDSIGNTRISSQSSDKATISAQRLAQQQQRLSVQTQELNNRQERARQTADRLALAQQRLTQAQQRFTASTTQSGRAVLNLDQQLGRVGGSLRNLGLGLVSLGASISVALTAPLTALGVLSARNAVTLDSLERGLTAITGSASEAGRQLARLTEIAKLPGIGFQEAIQGSIRLQAVGFSAGVAERALIQFSNAVALTGGGREELARITVQLGQLAAKGKVLAQDLKPIIEAGPAVGRALLQAFGTVNSEDIQALGLSSSQFIDKLLTQLEELPRAAAGLRNTFDNFSDAVFRASATIGNAILPVLTRLIEVAEPIITRLANGFAKLPAPVQTLVVTFGALAAAAGPALFVLGQFATGIGGLISAFGRLHALGLIPTIAGFKLLTQVMAGSASLAAGQAATTAAAAAGWGALGVAILGVVALAGGIYLLLNAQKDTLKISKEQIAATDAQIDGLKDQLKFINGLKDGVRRTADEQQRLTQIYLTLNTQAKVRVTAIADEEKRIVQLREELQRLLNLRNEERIQQAANLAASLAATAADIQANQDRRDAVTRNVAVNTALAESIQKSGRITTEQAKQLQELNLTGGTAERTVERLGQANEQLVRVQDELIKKGGELNGTAEEQGQILASLQRQTGLSARELLTLAKAMGLFKGNIETALASIERFSQAQVKAAKDTDIFTEALRKQNEELLKSGKAADEATKQRGDLIKSAASLAREASNSFEDALKFMRAFIAANPDLRAAIEKERQLAGKSFDEFIRDALGGDPAAQNRSAFRNAQQQLANALLDVTEASAAKLAAQQKASNDTQLQANETAHRLQLISYQQYLRAREILTTKNLDLEIAATALAAKNSREAQIRLLAEAKKAGIPEAERTRRLTQAATQEKAAIEAETRLVELENERAQIAAETKATLAEAAIQQLNDVRQLEIEYAELQGRIEGALKAATVERFREELEALAKTQDYINQQLNQFSDSLSAEEKVRLEAARAQNQRHIESIQNQIRQRDALAELAAAEQLVTNAKERQRLLEEDLTFQVEFRGLAEEEAIRQRLEGEARLQRSLELSRKIVTDTTKRLTDLGVAPPPELGKFVEGLARDIQGLSELPFAEQFRLVEKEFERINKDRIKQVEDLERAIFQKNISEIEGLIAIRRINNQYTDDLERQLDVLKRIAEDSGSKELLDRVHDIGEQVKDTTNDISSFGEEIRAVSLDATRLGLIDFFQTLTDRTTTLTEKLKELFDSIVKQINFVVARRLADKLFESIFGDPNKLDQKTGGGIVGFLRRLTGFGDRVAAGVGSAGGAGQAAATALGGGAVAEAATLQAGATAAATALTTGGATAGATLVTSLTAAATSFAAAVVAAGGAFAAAVAASSTVQGLGGLGGSFGGAATGIFPAQPGGMIRIVEGGYPEAVITTDPRHAARQVGILRELIQRTRGFYGRVRIPELAAGGIVSRETVESNLLNSINRAPSALSRLPDAALASSGGRNVTLRQIFVDDQRDISNWYNSAEGDRVQVEWIARNRSTVKQLLGVRD